MGGQENIQDRGCIGKIFVDRKYEHTTLKSILPMICEPGSQLSESKAFPSVYSIDFFRLKKTGRVMIQFCHLLRKLVLSRVSGNDFISGLAASKPRQPLKGVALKRDCYHQCNRTLFPFV